MIAQALCNGFKLDALQALASDVYKIALFTSAASLSKATTVYDATNEVPNSGTYVAGGLTLTGYQALLDGDTACVGWITDPQWTGATITARGALIYNATRGNKAVAVLDFGADKTSTNGTFTVTLPVPAAATALIRIT